MLSLSGPLVLASQQSSEQRLTDTFEMFLPIHMAMTVCFPFPLYTAITHHRTGKFTTPKREMSYDGSRRSSWTPGVPSNYRFVQQGTRRPAEYQLSRQCTPDEEDDCEDEWMPNINAVPMKQIRLGDQAQVLEYYEQILRGVQQLALKQILKEWIKEIEPKKQKNFPYKKEIRPKWWPEAAQYKEPDHIKDDGE